MAVDGDFYIPLSGKLGGDIRMAIKWMLHPEGRQKES